MTTTLRPAGAVKQADDGTRSRAYHVCVNSRTVGELEIGTDQSPACGRVRSLRIDEADRRRGRGTVALLAAEEVLRDWGCDRVRASAPAGAVAALRLLESLGYSEDREGTSQLSPETKVVPAVSEPPASGTALRHFSKPLL